MIREFFLETSEKYNDVFNTQLSEVSHMSRAEMHNMKTYLDDVWLNLHGVERQFDLHRRVIRTLYDCLLENLNSEQKGVEMTDEHEKRILEKFGLHFLGVATNLSVQGFVDDDAIAILALGDHHGKAVKVGLVADKTGLEKMGLAFLTIARGM